MTTQESPHEAEAVHSQLGRMRDGAVFARAGRMFPLLEYLVNVELEGGGNALNQYRIAIDVFGRDAAFDPTTDSIVRVEIGRLRNKLREYYAAEGAEDAIRLDVPKGCYRPTIEVCVGSLPATAVNANSAAAPRASSRPQPRTYGRVAAYAAAALVVVVLLVVIAGGFRGLDDTDEVARRPGASGADASSPGRAPARTDSEEAAAIWLSLQALTPAAQLEGLNRALTLDPEFADAHAFKAFLYSQALTNTAFGRLTEVGTEEIVSTIRDHAGRALALDPAEPLADVALGNLYLFTWRWADARRAYERAAAVTPDAVALAHYVYLDSFTGRHEAALRRIERLIVANPDWEPVLVSIRGFVLAVAGELDAAAASLRVSDGATRFNAGQLQSLLIERGWLAAVELARERPDAALRELRLIERLGVGQRDSWLPFLVYAYGRAGRTDEASRRFAELERAAAGGARIGAGGWALACLGIGDPDRALAWLDAAAGKAARHEPDDDFFALMQLRANLFADPVLEQPEMRAVLSKITGE